VAINSSPADPRGPGDAARPPLVIAVIGSARLSPPDPRCTLAAETGAAIAAQGWTMITGGYGGLMEVASRAAAQAGGRVIGLPMRGWGRLTPNAWNYELRWCGSYPERLAHLLAADAVVVLDGGIGTLSEAAIVWAALQTEPEAADLVFLGAGWQPVLDAIAANLVVDDRDLAHVTVCPDPRSAIAHIAEPGTRRRRSGTPLG
jgi:uncharacterized protein (TIGR00725 family)